MVICIYQLQLFCVIWGCHYVSAYGLGEFSIRSSSILFIKSQFLCGRFAPLRNWRILFHKISLIKYWILPTHMVYIMATPVAAGLFSQLGADEVELQECLSWKVLQLINAKYYSSKDNLLLSTHWLVKAIDFFTAFYYCYCSNLLWYHVYNTTRKYFADT